MTTIEPRSADAGSADTTRADTTPAPAALSTASTGSVAPEPARPRVRIPLWDNARFACVALVVIGHAIQRQTADSNNALTLYLLLYAFHMPAFAVISGYFSKAAPPGARQMRRIVTDILLPYVIMETIWTLVQFLVEGKREFDPTEPSWTLWFLLALAIFRVMLPYLALLKWPLLWAVIASIAVGYFANVDSTFSLSRAIGILPFFVLGWRLRHWGLIDRWRDAPPGVVWPVRALAVGAFAAWFAAVVVNIQVFRDMDLRFWFFYDEAYGGLGEDQWWAGGFRLVLIALAAVLSAAFLALIPRRATWFSAFGQATMYVYLLHSFVLYPIRETGILADQHSSATWLVSTVLASIAITIALSAPIVRRVFWPIIEPRPRWIFRNPDDPARPHRTDPTGSRRR